MGYSRKAVVRCRTQASGTLSADPGSLRLAKRSRIKGSLSSARKSVSWGTA